ncbi:MAG: fibrobacter succinogenes major paralogous domain-containing protein [Bacteroidota bacterium]
MKQIFLLSLLALSIAACNKDKDKDDDDTTEETIPVAEEGGGVYDIDSNHYATTVITHSGEWMASNLKACHYSNGDTIMSGRNLDDITGMPQPKFFFYPSGDSAKLKTYGRLYTYYVVEDPRGLCPTGWHVPGKDEWDTLKKYLGGQEVAGGKLKGTSLWVSPNEGADNETLFNAIPAGFREPDESYIDFGKTAIFWTSSSDILGWSFYVKYNYPTLFQAGNDKSEAFSVRCKRN